MAKINLLDRSVFELIAAGEVIERPASVIKELVENSIDAGAKHITVEIKDGGSSFMRVTDDGCGISHDEIPTAFLRHATSKVKTADDLDKILTLGFRGEALASVAAVARVEVLTKEAGTEYGSSFKINGGEITEHEHTGCPDGTTIIIRDLFYNVPARQKFLKRDVTEGNQVQGLIDKLALAHPDISFRFIRDNKPVRHTGGDGDYYSAIYAVFGKQFAMSLIPVDYSMNGVTVTGYTSSPLFTRPNRSMQYFFVNGRYVRSVICLTALEEGYRNSIMTGKFPACVLNITINPELCDVNVSPSKTEVRFADEKNIFDLINFGIKNAILNADNRRELKLEKKPVQNTIVEQTEEKPLSVRVEKALEAVPQDKYKEKIQKTLEDDRIYKVKEKPVIFHSPVSNIQPKKMEKSFVQQRIEEKTEINPVHIPEKKKESIEAEPVPEKEQYIAPVPEEKTDNTFKYISGSALQKTETVITEEPEKPSIKVIGELFATYILCQCGEEFIMIDKHAAHERINFEKKKTELMTSSQLLAESEYIDLSPEQYSVLSENTDKLMDAGIEVILTDGFRCEITACPSAFAGENVRPSDIVIPCAELLCSGNDNIIGEIYDDLLHSRACKVSIKANDLNSREELRVIAEEVWNNEKIRFCPHGRPVMIKMTKQEIEKYFSRIV
ncbi:MAG: DNA mismatch repair endonuclease MutL [Ruminiclostridium sp.]|nr:DNA mismatch repair endonuclease MutL [Ruminiclostridium sp.]